MSGTPTADYRALFIVLATVKVLILPWAPTKRKTVSLMTKHAALELSPDQMTKACLITQRPNIPMEGVIGHQTAKRGINGYK